MPEFRFSCPIEVRYADLDPQGHVNNACFLTYFEQSRIHYLMELGLLAQGVSTFEIGLIIAEARVTYLKPVLLGMVVRVALGVTHLGNKSFTIEYLMSDASSGVALAKGLTVIVTFDYARQLTVPIPEIWRGKITSYEGLNGSP